MLHLKFCDKKLLVISSKLLTAILSNTFEKKKTRSLLAWHEITNIFLIRKLTILETKFDGLLDLRSVYNCVDCIPM